MKIYIGKPPKPGGPERFTIGEMMSRPSEELLKKLGFERPLRRLAKELVGKYQGAIGIEVQGIGFSFLLDPNEKDGG
jgi:hypothetical protein